MLKLHSILLLFSVSVLVSAAPLCGVFEWEQNRKEAAAILKNLKEIGENAEIFKDDNFCKYDVVIVPKANATPLFFRDAVPKFLQKGKHIIFDGWPAKSYDGKRYAKEWDELLPGTTHVVMDTAHVYKGLYSSKGTSVLLKTGNGSVPFAQMKLNGVKNILGRAMTKCQWRLTGPLSTGKMEYNDCMDVNLIAIHDAKGKILGQHTAMVRHFCKFFPAANVVCADFQKDPALKLLYGAQAKEYLKFLLASVRNPLDDEPSKEYWTNLHALKLQTAELKLRYNEMIYLYKDLYFYRNNAVRMGMKVYANPEKAFLTLENECLDLFSQYTKFRFNRFPFAVKRKVRLLAAVKKQISKIDSFLKQGKALEQKYLAAYKGKRFVMPEKGIIDIKTSYSDYLPLSWGGAPGFTEYENGRAMARLGIVGSCSPNYVSRGGYRVPTPEVLKEDRYVKNVFSRYVKETGMTKFTSHEIPTGMIPYSLVQKYDDTTYIVDLKKGTKRKPKNRFEYTLNKNGVGIISSAAKSPEFQELLNFIAKRAVGLKGVHTRSVSHEGMIVGGYSEYGFRMYREFLKKRHGSIENLNKAWNTNWKSFDEIYPPLKVHTTQQEHANHYDWVSFRAEEFLNFYKNLTATFRKYDPACKLTACINQESPLQAVEFYEFCGLLDFAASHNTPTSAPWYQINLGRKGQLADNNEPKWLGGSHSWNRSNSEDELQKSHRYNMLYHAIQGMSQFAPFEWFHGNNARLAENDGGLFLAGAEFKEFNRWKEKWQNLMGAVMPKDHAKTGIYWSFVTKSHGRGGVTDGSLADSFFCSYFRHMGSWNALLDDKQISYVTIPRQRVKNNEISDLKTLIVPQAYYLEGEVMEKLLKFAENGGELILEGQVGKYDQYKKEDNRIYNELGLVPIATTGKQLAGGKGVQDLLTQEGVGTAYLTFEMIDPDNVEVLAKYADSNAAAVRIKYGKGTVICTGFSIAGNTDDAFVSEVLKKSMDNRVAFVAAKDSLLYPWQGKNGYYYLAILNKTDQWRELPVQCHRRIAEAYDIETGLPIAFKGNTVAVSTFPAGARFIAVRFADGGK